MSLGTLKTAPFSDAEVKSLLRAAQNGDQISRERLVNENQRLVWSVVQRFLNRGYEADDLFQVGCIGLLKSIDKFDLSFDVRFSTYAVPMIIGEIKRFLRDDGVVKVSRSIRETANKVRGAIEYLSSAKKGVPTINEVATHLNIGYEEVVLAQEANRLPASIDETVYENDGDPITLLDQLSAEEGSIWSEQVALKEAISGLTKREQLIVYLRYFKDQTQSEVSLRLGVSQVQVSRLEKKIIAAMKQRLM